MAYTGYSTNTQTNPFLAYTGRGGSNRADNITLPPGADVMSPKNMSGLYGSNPALPNTGPESLNKSTIPTNMGSMQRGGSCNTCTNVMQGGSCSSCNYPVMNGGSCGCNKLMGGKQKGGQTINPQGLLGSSWTPNSRGWPGVDGISGNRNYLSYNDYKVDPQTALISLGANRPFLFGGSKKNAGKRRKRLTKRRKQRGGNGSNLLSQDFINLGRQIQYNLGSSYNALNGYPAPTPVLPWQGQLPRTPNLNTIRGNSL